MDRQLRTRLINELAVKCGRYSAREMECWPDKVLLFQVLIHNSVHAISDDEEIDASYHPAARE